MTIKDPIKPNSTNTCQCHHTAPQNSCAQLVHNKIQQNGHPKTPKYALQSFDVKEGNNSGTLTRKGKDN